MKDAMTPDVKTATPSLSLTDAAKLMKQEDVGSVPVVDGERLIGMLTDRDIVVRGIADGSDPQKVLEATVGKLRIRRFELAMPSLEEIFIEKVGGESLASEVVR